MNASLTLRHHFSGALLLAGSWLLGSVAQAVENAATGVAPDEPVVHSGESVRVSVFFATNRQRDKGEPGETVYGAKRGEPGFGRCDAEFTRIPVMSDFAPRVPFYVPAEWNHIGVSETIDADDFQDRVVAAAKRTATGSVIVFVHGYNYDFERTCRMAAEVQRALAGQATILMFSWPSNGRPADYVADQADVEWSVPFLSGVLAELGERLGVAKVQVLAHSLGSRGVLFALQRLSAETRRRPLIDSLVLLAPDFDAQAFLDRLPALLPLVRGITLYASSEDTPLKLSQQLSGSPRLGQAGEYLTVVEGMETIDVSTAGRYQILGHEYFYYHPLVAADLVTLLVERKGAAERAGLRPNTRDGVVYWEILPAGSG